MTINTSVFSVSMFICLMSFQSTVVAWSLFEVEDSQVPDAGLQINASFVEIHSGPGRGYPVFYVAVKNEKVTLIKRKTDWVKVETQDKTVGWIEISALKKSIVNVISDEDVGEDVFDDFWFASVMAGQLDEATEMSLQAGYQFTKNISSEISLTQVLGDFSESKWLAVSLSHQPFPEWRLSPVFSLGGGLVDISPKTTLARDKKRQEDTIHFGVGIRYRVSQRFYIVAEYKEITAFTERDDNETVNEWHTGLGVRF